MAERTIGVGLIGAGFAASTHARAYARAADLGARLVAVAGQGRARAEELARKFAIPAAYDDYRRVLDDKGVQLVDLCVPNNLHQPFALQAIAAGKHVLVEKPLTGYFGGPEAREPVGSTPKRVMLEGAVSGAERLLRAARERGVRLMYAENWLHAPAVQKTKRLAEASGGTILEIRAQECHSGSHASYAKSWRLAGGGALLRLGSHPLGCVLYLKWQEGLRRDGRPIRARSVTAEVGDLSQIPSVQREQETWLVTGWEDVESWATLLIAFEDGSRATISAADTVLGGMQDSLDVFLSNGRVRCDLTHSTLLQAYAPSAGIFAGEYLQEKLETKAGWSHPSVDEDFLLGFPQEIRDSLEAVLNDRPPLGTAELGLEVVWVSYAGYVSAEEGRRVDLESV